MFVCSACLPKKGPPDVFAVTVPHIRRNLRKIDHAALYETGHELPDESTCSGDPDSGFPVGTISKTVRLSVDRSLSGHHRTGFIEIIPGSIRRLVPAGHHVAVRIKPVPASADLLPLVLTPGEVPLAFIT